VGVLYSPRIHPLQYGWNCFDFLIVTLSLVDLLADDVKGLSMHRSFRLLRFFKMAKSWKPLNDILTIMANTLGTPFNLTFILYNIFWIFNVMGMQLFFKDNFDLMCERLPYFQACATYVFPHTIPAYFLAKTVDAPSNPKTSKRSKKSLLCNLTFVPCITVCIFYVMGMLLRLFRPAFGKDFFDLVFGRLPYALTFYAFAACWDAYGSFFLACAAYVFPHTIPAYFLVNTEGTPSNPKRSKMSFWSHVTFVSCIIVCSFSVMGWQLRLFRPASGMGAFDPVFGRPLYALYFYASAAYWACPYVRRRSLVILKRALTLQLSSFSEMGGVKASADVREDLECPVCLLVPTNTPVYQCENGHLVCRGCHGKLTHCPTCRTPLGKIRNRAIEKVISKMQL